jgi:hypothetical protein
MQELAPFKGPDPAFTDMLPKVTIGSQSLFNLFLPEERRFIGFFSGFVVNTNWRDLKPTLSPITDTEKFTIGDAVRRIPAAPPHREVGNFH